MAPPVPPVAKKLGIRRAKSAILSEREGTNESEVAAAPPAVLELRRLVGIHKNLTTDIQRLVLMITDRTLKTGEVIKCTKSEAVKDDVRRSIETMKAEQRDYVRAMREELRKVPVYRTFLEKVYGVGEVTAAYLVAMVRIERCPNVSNLIRYCGNAPDFRTGWRESKNTQRTRVDPARTTRTSGGTTGSS